MKKIDSPHIVASSTVAPRIVTARSFGVGLFLSLLLCGFTPYNDFKVAATYIAGTQFPIGALFFLFVIVLINAFLPLKKRFQRGEMLTVWTLILVTSGLPTSGMMRYFLPAIVAPVAFSDDTNNWKNKVWGDTPAWLRVQDAEAAKAFFNGYHRGEEHIPWGPWIVPLLAWSLLAMLFLLATYCITSILRKQWVENEKFSFPFVALPMMLAETPEPGRRLPQILYSPVLWFGFILVTALHTMKGLHQLYPTVPDIIIENDLNQYMTVRPWNQIGWVPLRFYPMVMGIAYLLPGEVCFSLWFFYIVTRLQQAVCVQFNFLMPGTQGYGDAHFLSLQAYGGGLALVGWTLWTGRQHFRNVWQKATGGVGAKSMSIDDSGEMLSYKAAFWGLVFAYVGIFTWLFVAQVQPLVILVSLVTLTLAFVVISWVVCQAGMLFMAQPYGSIDPLTFIFGSSPFKIGSLFTMTRFENMFIFDTREMLAPSILMGAKTIESKDGGGKENKKLLGAMVITTLLGFAVALYASLWLPYYGGGGNALNNPFTYLSAPQRPYNFLAGAASVPFKGDLSNSLHIITGIVLVLGLLLLRAQFNVGIHPIGFLCGSVYSIKMLVFSLFCGWAVKAVLQRYGGMKGYLGALPFFLGLILGDVVNAVIWIVVGNITGVGYQLMPG